MIPSFIGTRIRWNVTRRLDRPLVRRLHPLHQPLAVRAAHGDEDDEAEQRATPDRRSARPDGWRARSIKIENVAIEPTIAGSGMSTFRDAHVERRAVGARQVGLVDRAA